MIIEEITKEDAPSSLHQHEFSSDSMQFDQGSNGGMQNIELYDEIFLLNRLPSS